MLRPVPPKPVIVSRAAWGARPPDHNAPNETGFTDNPRQGEWYEYTGRLEDIYKTVAIHHSASLLITNETMQDAQNLHMDKNGWADIAYHFGIDKDGVIYEGRDLRARGASVAGHNTGTMGVMVMGNFVIDQPRPEQLDALQSLVNWLAATYNLTHLAGHGEFNPESVCPGRFMIDHLDAIAQAADLQRGTGGYVPVV